MLCTQFEMPGRHTRPELLITVGLERDENSRLPPGRAGGICARNQQPVGATREEVFKAVVEGLGSCPLPVSRDARRSLTGTRSYEAVRECLEEFEFPSCPSAIGAEMSKEDMLDAVHQGLRSFDFPCRSQAGLLTSEGRRGQMQVREGLHSFDFPTGASHRDVVHAVKEGTARS